MQRRRVLAGLAGLAVAPRTAWSAPATHLYADPARRGVAPRVDVESPERPRGAVLLVHGGGFLLGSRRMPSMRRCANELSAAGLVALSVDYRLLLRGGRFDEACDDVRSCMAWWREVAPSFGAPADRLGVMGLSAGGALAAIAAAEGGASAWVGVYGPYDFRRLPGQPALDAPTRWLLATDDPDELLARSPLTRALTPVPTLLFHGSRDRLVPIAHAEALVEARRSAGVPVDLRPVDAGHGYLQHDTPIAADTLRQAVAFFADHLA